VEDRESSQGLATEDALLDSVRFHTAEVWSVDEYSTSMRMVGKEGGGLGQKVGWFGGLGLLLWLWLEMVFDRIEGCGSDSETCFISSQGTGIRYAAKYFGYCYKLKR